MNQLKLHYHLVSGQVFCHPVGKPEDVTALMANAVITTKTRCINATELGRAQSALAMEIRRRTEGTELIVLDVTLGAISYLGEMAPEEFQAAPEAEAKPTAAAPSSVN